MNQTRLGSLIEVCFNTAIGLAISQVANMLIFPLFGFNVSAGQAFSIGVIYTAISVIRGYVVRRFFNAALHRAAMRLAGARE